MIPFNETLRNVNDFVEIIADELTTAICYQKPEILHHEFDTKTHRLDDILKIISSYAPPRRVVHQGSSSSGQSFVLHYRMYIYINLCRMKTLAHFHR